jgi:hypothetical protein
MVLNYNTRTAYMLFVEESISLNKAVEQFCEQESIFKNSCEWMEFERFETAELND